MGNTNKENSSRKFWSIICSRGCDKAKNIGNSNGPTKVTTEKSKPVQSSEIGPKDAKTCARTNHFKPGRDTHELVDDFCSACLRNDSENVEKMIQDGFPIDSVNYCGLTGLHKCASVGNQKCLRLLLERGCNPDIQDDIGGIELFYFVLLLFYCN